LVATRNIYVIVSTGYVDLVYVNNMINGIAEGVGGKWEHAPWGANLGGAPAHFLQSFKN